jgi:hypothetical protein
LILIRKLKKYALKLKLKKFINFRFKKSENKLQEYFRIPKWNFWVHLVIYCFIENKISNQIFESFLDILYSISVYIQLQTIV